MAEFPLDPGPPVPGATRSLCIAPCGGGDTMRHGTQRRCPGAARTGAGGAVRPGGRPKAPAAQAPSPRVAVVYLGEGGGERRGRVPPSGDLIAGSGERTSGSGPQPAAGGPRNGAGATEQRGEAPGVTDRAFSCPAAGASGWKPPVCTAREGRLGPEILRERDFQGDLEEPLRGAERGPALRLRQGGGCPLPLTLFSRVARSGFPRGGLSTSRLRVTAPPILFQTQVQQPGGSLPLMDSAEKGHP